jgi:hypothetical protein
MKLKFATSRKVAGRWHFHKTQQGGLGFRWGIGGQDIFETTEFPSFSKTLA